MLFVQEQEEKLHQAADQRRRDRAMVDAATAKHAAAEAARAQAQRQRHLQLKQAADQQVQDFRYDCDRITRVWPDLSAPL